MLDTHIYNWLMSGADPQIGLRLFMDCCGSKSTIARIISKNLIAHQQIIKLALLRKAKIPLSESMKVSHNTLSTIKSKSDYKFREQWPFLADQDCPAELKLLVADKITAYRNCVAQYDNLSNATTPEDQLLAVSSLVTNFINNHDIFKELAYYKTNNKILGLHPIFEQYRRLKDLRNLRMLDLIKKKENLEHTIWRNKSNIKKGDKPELTDSRLAKIREYEIQLAEVLRLLE